MSTAERNRAIVRWFIEQAWPSHGNLFLTTCLRDDAVIHTDSDDTVPYHAAAARALLDRIYTAFPDLHVTVLQLAATADLVFAHVRLRGTNTGDLIQGSGERTPGTGRPITISEFNVYRLVDSKIAEAWSFVDVETMTRQLLGDEDEARGAQGGTA